MLQSSKQEIKQLHQGSRIPHGAGSDWLYLHYFVEIFNINSAKESSCFRPLLNVIWTANHSGYLEKTNIDDEIHHWLQGARTASGRYKKRAFEEQDFTLALAETAPHKQASQSTRNNHHWRCLCKIFIHLKDEWNNASTFSEAMAPIVSFEKLSICIQLQWASHIIHISATRLLK